MVDLAYYVNAIKNGKEVICIQEQWVQDNLAEVETIAMEWLHDSGVVIRCTKIDAAGQEIRPMKKNFYNVCQESFWLSMN